MPFDPSGCPPPVWLLSRLAAHLPVRQPTISEPSLHVQGGEGALHA
jgi:hypothetical protein